MSFQPASITGYRHHMVRESSKDAILDAAEAIVREQGAAHLTLDAAAERAGLSKGGGTGRTTFPCTSVKRKCRPWYLNVSLV